MTRGLHVVMFTSFGVDLTESIVAHLVHHAILQRWRSFGVDSEFARWSVVIRFFDMLPFLGATSNPNHPQKLVDIIR